LRGGERHRSIVLLIAGLDPIIHHFALSRFREGVRGPAVVAARRAHGDRIADRIAWEPPYAG
jgi:hypothetical protein